MSEVFHQSAGDGQEISKSDHEYEQERLEALKRLVAECLEREDAEFLDELDAGEGTLLNYVYGRLLELGKDPDEVLSEYGITEEDGGEV